MRSRGGRCFRCSLSLLSLDLLSPLSSSSTMASPLGPQVEYYKSTPDVTRFHQRPSDLDSAQTCSVCLRSPFAAPCTAQQEAQFVAAFMQCATEVDAAVVDGIVWHQSAIQPTFMWTTSPAASKLVVHEAVAGIGARAGVKLALEDEEVARLKPFIEIIWPIKKRHDLQALQTNATTA